MSDNFSINGGRETIVTNSTPQFGVYLSSQYIKVNNLEPIPTDWVVGRRPIYDRMPRASERYWLNFSYDENAAYPYIPVGEGITGRTSMVVQTSGDNKFLVIQAGKIVWKYGTIDTDPVIIDLELVGISSAKYLLAYQLYYDDAPIQAQYTVENLSLSGFKMDLSSSTDSVTGWRYTPQYAFTGLTERFWSNYDGMFPSYSNNASLNWQLPLPCAFTKIILRCPINTTFSGTATLYYMACGDTESNEFCKEPIWTFAETVSVSRDDVGQYFLFSADVPVSTSGWKVEWSDPSIAINEVLVTGTVTQMRKPATLTTNYALVAYPVNSVPSKFTNSLGEEVPLVLCKLAYVDINSAYTVEDITDIREIVFTNYEPIAEWLTRTWDENLMRLFDQVKDYSTTWMGPTSCMNQEYASLEESDIVVNFDDCPSPNYQSIL